MWTGRILAWCSLGWYILGWRLIQRLFPWGVYGDTASLGVGVVFACLCVAAIHHLRRAPLPESDDGETDRLSGTPVTRFMWRVERRTLLAYCVVNLILVLPLHVLFYSIH